MVLGPLNAIKQVTEIGFHWNVMYIGLELLVKELIILRVLFEDNRVAGEKVRKTVCCHRSINVHLVFVLTTQFFCKWQNFHQMLQVIYVEGCMGHVLRNNFIGALDTSDCMVRPPLFQDCISNCTNLFRPEPNRTRHRIFAFVSLLFGNL